MFFFQLLLMIATHLMYFYFELQYHPDVSKDSRAADAFKSIRHAYEVSILYTTTSFYNFFVRDYFLSQSTKCRLSQSRHFPIIRGMLQEFDFLYSPFPGIFVFLVYWKAESTDLSKWACKSLDAEKIKLETKCFQM